jgi:hypothetical protein
MNNAQRVFTARHTRNVESALAEAQSILNISTEWAKSFSETAEKMLSIPMTLSSARMDTLIGALYPEKPQETDRQKRNRDNINMTIRALYQTDRNSAGYGDNGWSAYNAIVEYLDHYRDGGVMERAVASMDANSSVTHKKIKAQEVILSFA